MVRFYDPGFEFILSLALIALLMLVEVMDEYRGFWERLSSRPTYVRWSLYYGLILPLIVLGKWGLAELSRITLFGHPCLTLRGRYEVYKVTLAA